MALELLKSELETLGYHVKLTDNKLSAGVIIGWDDELGATLVNYWMRIHVDKQRDYILENHRVNLDVQNFSSKLSLVARIKKEFPL